MFFVLYFFVIFFFLIFEAKGEFTCILGAMYPIDPANMFKVDFPLLSKVAFLPAIVVTSLAMPKSETIVVKSSLRRTLLGFRSSLEVESGGANRPTLLLYHCRY